MKTEVVEEVYLGPPTVTDLEAVRPENPDPRDYVFELSPTPDKEANPGCGEGSTVWRGFLPAASPRLGMAQDSGRTAGAGGPVLCLGQVDWRPAESRHPQLEAPSRATVFAPWGYLLCSPAGDSTMTQGGIHPPPPWLTCPGGGCSCGLPKPAVRLETIPERGLSPLPGCLHD